MKVGIVTTWFERGAAYVSKQFRDILKQDHEVFIYARGGESYGIGDPNWDDETVTWGRPPASYASSDVNYQDFKSWLVNNDIDCVLFNEQLMWEPVLICRDLQVITGAYIDYYTERSVPMFGVYDFIVCNTRRHYSVFDWHPNSIYLPWGTDTALYTPENNSSKDKVHFFHSAGMSPYRKGTDMVLKAMPLLSGDAKLVIHSQVKLQDTFPDLGHLIKDLVNNDKLEVIEETVTAPGLYYRGDVYVYPSRLDGIGLTILEAAASGLPIIVPDNGPMNEFVIGSEDGTENDSENGKTASIDKLWSRWDGYYWPQCETNIDDLAKAMQYYVDRFDDIESLKEAARQSALEYFDWQKNTAEFSGQLVDLKRLPDSEVATARQSAEKNDRSRLKHAMKSSKQRIVDELKFDYPRLFKLIGK